MSMASNNDDEMIYNLSFSGAGFLGTYHVGAISCLKYYGKKLLDRTRCYAGCSAGALAVVALLCDIDIESGLMIFMDVATKIREGILGPFSPSFDQVTIIKETFNTKLPENAYQILSGKFFVSMTRVSDWKNVVVSEFRSNEELIDALICTSFIPFYSGIEPPKFKGHYYIDGAFSDNLLQDFEGTTITVSVFSGESDICPDDAEISNSMVDMNNVTVLFTTQNINRLIKALFPADSAVLSDMCRQGYKDTLKYLNSHYPEMLTIDMYIVSRVMCNCTGRLNKVISVDENTEICCCENSKFSHIEQTIAREKVFNCLVFPTELQEILTKAEMVASNRDLISSLIQTAQHIARWMITQSYYTSQYIYAFVNALLLFVTTKLENHKLVNPMVHKVLKIAKDAYHSYHNSASFKWHPSLGEEKHADIIKSRKRLLTAVSSLETLSIADYSFEDVTFTSRSCSVNSDIDDVVLGDEKKNKDETKYSCRKFAKVTKMGSGLFLTDCFDDVSDIKCKDMGTPNVASRICSVNSNIDVILGDEKIKKDETEYSCRKFAKVTKMGSGLFLTDCFDDGYGSDIKCKDMVTPNVTSRSCSASNDINDVSNDEKQENEEQTIFSYRRFAKVMKLGKELIVGDGFVVDDVFYDSIIN